MFVKLSVFKRYIAHEKYILLTPSASITAYSVRENRWDLETDRKNCINYRTTIIAKIYFPGRILGKKFFKSSF